MHKPPLLPVLREPWRAEIQSAARFLDAGVAEPFAEFEGCGEALVGERVLAESEVSDAARSPARGPEKA
jgi:hypothetical protein